MPLPFQDCPYNGHPGPPQCPYPSNQPMGAWNKFAAWPKKKQLVFEIIFTVAIKAMGLQTRNFIELHRLSNEELNAVGLILLVLTANVLLKYQAFVNERKKSMNKILFAIFVVMLSLGVTLYLSQKTDAGTPEVSVSASCGDNSASSSASISITGNLVLGERYEGRATCDASAGWEVAPTDSGPIWVEVVQRGIWFVTWLDTKSKSRQASRFLYTDRNFKNPVRTSASASADFDGKNYSKVCPTSS